MTVERLNTEIGSTQTRLSVTESDTISPSKHTLVLQLDTFANVLKGGPLPQPNICVTKKPIVHHEHIIIMTFVMMPKRAFSLTTKIRR